MNKNKKILILANRYTTLLNFRFELIERLLENDYELITSLPYHDKIQKLKDIGCIYEDINIDRHGINPAKELNIIKEYSRLIKKYNPNLILSFTIKPNIYGAIANKKAKIPQIANFTGLGTAIMNDDYKKQILKHLYKYAFKNVDVTFFQNKGNLKFFIDNNIINDNYKLIPGSGVNITKFTPLAYPKESDKINLLYVGKMMKDKGIDNLLEATKKIKDEQGQKVVFRLVGRFEEDYKNKINEAVANNTIEYLKETDDIQSLYKWCHALVHPTYHEGMSNVMQEAAASTRPVIASEIHGCKEIFDESKTGFGFEVKNTDSLINAINKFIALPYDEKVKMGKLGRDKMEKEFDRNIVINAYI